MTKKYVANIVPLNAEGIGTAPHGTATFTETGNQLHVTIEMFDTRPTRNTGNISTAFQMAKRHRLLLWPKMSITTAL